MASHRTRMVVLAGLGAALVAVGAWVAVPVGQVPVTGQTLMVMLVVLLLPPVAAGASLGTYVLLGAVGAPIFAGGKGGLAVLAGPTGGFLIGFVVGAWLGALLRDALNLRGSHWWADVTAVTVTLAVTYLFGWAQLAFGTGLGPSSALVAGVAPFVVWDLLKAAVALILASAVRRALPQFV